MRWRFLRTTRFFSSSFLFPLLLWTARRFSGFARRFSVRANGRSASSPCRLFVLFRRFRFTGTGSRFRAALFSFLLSRAEMKTCYLYSLIIIIRLLVGLKRVWASANQHLVRRSKTLFYSSYHNISMGSFKNLDCVWNYPNKKLTMY